MSRVDPFEAIRFADYSRDQVLITWQPGTSEAAKASILRQFNLTLSDTSGRFFDVALLPDRANRGNQTVEGTVRLLNLNGAVAVADFDIVIKPDQAVPNDPLFNQQWGLRNTGQSGGTAGADIRSLAALALPNPVQTVVVAVCDDGVDYTHPDLAPVMWSNPGEIPGNNIDDDNNGFVDDTRGWDFWDNDNDPKPNSDGFGGIDSHGTHVAGTVTSATNNGIGIAGTSRNARVMAMKMYGAVGNTNFISALANSVDYAWRNGARVITVSYNIDGYNQTLLDSIGRAKTAGVVYLNSAGNNGQQNPRRQAIRSIHDNVIFVAASDRRDTRAGFSNFGTLIEIFSPGVDIMSTLPGNDYGMSSGTSMATPMAAGAVAHLRGAFPADNPRRILNRLIQGGAQIPALANFVAQGRRVDMLGAMQVVVSGGKDPGTITGINTVLGTWISGNVASVNAEDSSFYTVDSVMVARQGHFATVDATATLPQGSFANPLQLDFTLTASASTPGVTLVMSVWNRATGAWDTVRSMTAPTADARVTAGLGRNVRNYVAPNGTVIVRTQFLNQVRRAGQTPAAFRGRINRLLVEVTAGS